MKNIEAIIDKALDEMPDDFVIKDFLMQNRAEVKEMFLAEYVEEKLLERLSNEEQEEPLDEKK